MSWGVKQSSLGFLLAGAALLLSSSLWAQGAARPTTQVPDTSQAWLDLQTKAALNGLVEASVTYQGQQAQVWVQSKRRFIRPAEQAKALQAAQLIQRDVAVFCGSHCLSLPMPAPQMQSDGRLSFVLRLQGLGRQLFEEELQALLSGSTGLPAAPAGSSKSSTSSAGTRSRFGV